MILHVRGSLYLNNAVLRLKQDSCMVIKNQLGPSYLSVFDGEGASVLARADKALLQPGDYG